MKCNVCGSTNLIKGSVGGSDGSAGSDIFVPDDKPFFKRMFSLDSRKIHCYACVHCNNLQFTVDFNEGDKKKYLKFEGQQPSLMERLESE
jgi:hypothetical protein